LTQLLRCHDGHEDPCGAPWRPPLFGSVVMTRAAFQRVGTLRALNSISGWLVAVVRRECLRMAARVMGKPVNLDEALLNAANEDRLTHLPHDELRLDLSRAIQSLPENYREVVLLRDIEEMTVDEIAATLNLTRESVKGRLRRARALLREYLLS